MEPREFMRIQSSLILTNREMAIALDQSERAVENWRGGICRIPGSVARLLTIFESNPDLIRQYRAPRPIRRH